MKKYLQWTIIIIDILFVWNMSFFFTVASTFLNYMGTVLIVVLVILTIKIFSTKQTEK